MRLKLRSIRGTIRVTFVLLLVASQVFLSQPLILARIGDRAQVSPGKIPYLPPDEEDNHYLGNDSVKVKLEYPKSFILQETVGDLSFLISSGSATKRIDIYIPPEFQVTASKKYVWSNITNNYGNIGISKVSSSDRRAPNWYRVSVTSETQMDSGSYSVRVFNVTAPSIVGRYFFKVLTDGTSIDTKDFPTVVVSADPNPAYVSGTIRYGGRLTNYSHGPPIGKYGAPIKLNPEEGGKVCAAGVTAEGRIVVGRAFFNNSTEISSDPYRSYTYTLYGLAPGRYTLNATAAGYAPGELLYPILLKAGQSLEGVDIFLERSPFTTVVALSRWMKQPVGWGAFRNGTDISDQPKIITLEIFDHWNTTIRLLNRTTEPKSTSYTFWYCGEIDLDGHIPQEYANYTGGIGPGRYYFRVWVNGYVQPSAANERALRSECAVVFTRNEQNRLIEILLEKTGRLIVTVHFMNSTQILRESGTWWDGTLTVEAYDLVEEIRARNSTFVEARTNVTSVELTGLFGSSRDYGLPPGQYIVFAKWTLKARTDALRLYSVGAGYVSVGEVYLPSAYRYGPTGHRVTIGEGLSEISFWVVLQGGLNVTVFPITWQKPFDIAAWKYPDSPVSVEIRDRYGVETYGSFRLSQDNGILPDGRKFPVNNTASVIGLDDGTYSIYVFTYGYVQRQDVFFSVRRGEFADISVLMTIGVQIEVILVFEKQRMISRLDTYAKYWKAGDPKVPVRLEVYDSKAQFVGANVVYVPNANKLTTFAITLAGFNTTYYGNAAMRWINYYDTTDGTGQKDGGLKPDLYTIKAYVPGYDQPAEPTIDIRAGGNVSLVLTLHRMAHLRGTIRTFNTYFANYTRISWVSVDAVGEKMTLWTCTPDGDYELWMVPGSYLVAFSLPTYETRTLRVEIPDGSDVRMDLQLLQLGMKPQSAIFPVSSLIVAYVLKRNFGHSALKYISKVSKT